MQIVRDQRSLCWKARWVKMQAHLCRLATPVRTMRKSCWNEVYYDPAPLPELCLQQLMQKLLKTLIVIVSGLSEKHKNWLKLGPNNIYVQQGDWKLPCKDLMQGKRNWETADSLFSGNIVWNIVLTCNQLLKSTTFSAKCTWQGIAGCNVWDSSKM